MEGKRDIFIGQITLAICNNISGSGYVAILFGFTVIIQFAVNGTLNFKCYF